MPTRKVHGFDRRVFDPEHPERVVEAWEPKGSFGRARGLLGTNPIGPGKGLLLRSRQVHTVGMNYAIDAIHIAADGTVLRVYTLKPVRFGPMIWRTRWILEVEAGEADRLCFSEGVKLEIS